MRHTALPGAVAAATVVLALSGLLAASLGAPRPALASPDPKADAKAALAKLPARGRSEEYRQAVQAIEAMRKKKPASVSTGTYVDGGIESPAEMPAKGFGYRLADGKRKTHFGSDMMVYGLLETAALLQERYPKSPWLSIGDISGEKGGKLSPHINHQDGCDVDVAFLYCNEQGQPADKGWLRCDAEGKAKGARLDGARCFDFLDLFVSSPYTGGCEWIFVYDGGKKVILEAGRAKIAAYSKNPRAAKEVERLKASLETLEKLLRQPTSSPHDDHFHIRVSKEGPSKGAAPEETGAGMSGGEGAKGGAAKKDGKDAKKAGKGGKSGADPVSPEEPRPGDPEGDGDDEGEGGSDGGKGAPTPPAGGDEDDD